MSEWDRIKKTLPVLTNEQEANSPVRKIRLKLEESKSVPMGGKWLSGGKNPFTGQ